MERDMGAPGSNPEREREREYQLNTDRLAYGGDETHDLPWSNIANYYP